MTKNAAIAIYSFDDWFIRLLTKNNLHSQDATLTTPVVFTFPFLGAFANRRKASMSFVMSVCLSVCPHGKLGSHWKDFYETWYSIIFRKTVQ
jgi:hypothetical protein